MNTTPGAKSNVGRLDQLFSEADGNLDSISVISNSLRQIADQLVGPDQEKQVPVAPAGSAPGCIEETMRAYNTRLLYNINEINASINRIRDFLGR